MANYLTTDTDLTSVANAIRTKGGTSAQLAFPSGFVSAINDISGGGGYTADDWLDPTKPTGEVSSNSTSFPRAWLYGHTGITKLSIPNATSVPGEFAMNCSGITQIVAPALTTTGTWAFATNTSLDHPVYMPLVTLGGNTFNGCSKLPAAVYYRIAGSNQQVFYNCSLLASVDQISSNPIPYKTFISCAVLQTVVLRSSTVVSLASTNNFDGTPFKSGGSGGTIYIPESLYDHLGDGTADDYQAATNWSTIHARGTITWAKIEGSYYETHYADGTAIPTT